MENCKISLVQMESRVGETEENLKKIKHFVEAAKVQETDIICFPEMAVHGYALDECVLWEEGVREKSIQFLSKLSQVNEMTILTGFCEKEDRDLFYITQVVCFPDGRVQRYRKTHLGEREKKRFVSGDVLPVFHEPKATFGIEICWDSHFPEVSTVLSLQGAEIIFVPHASPLSSLRRRELWLKYIPARAYDNTVFVACCNLVGTNGKDKQFGGGILVVDPKGNIIAQDFTEKESMVTVFLAADQVNLPRQHERISMGDSFFLYYRKPQLYKKLWKSEERRGE